MTGIQTKLIMASICGEANSGKSSIVNLLCGRRISIVSSKPQASRFNVRGIANYNKTQIVFIDTPGVFKPKVGGVIERQIARNAWDGIRSGEKIILVVDPRKKFQDGFKYILHEIERTEQPAILLINKMDMLTKEQMDEFEEGLGENAKLFEKIFRVSAKLNVGFVPVIEHLQETATISPWLYNEGEFTDQTDEQILAEITREVIFKNLEQEIPYNTVVRTEQIKETEDIIEVLQTIIVERDGQKKIIIGAKGTMLLILLRQSSLEMQKVLGGIGNKKPKRVKVTLFVKVSQIKEGML